MANADGWIEGAWSSRLRSPHDALMSRLWGRLKLSSDVGDVYVYAAADAMQNWRIEGESGFGLHEAWLEYVGKGWDVRAGRQVIIWGKADGVQITDLVSPPDYTEFITRDIEEVRQAVDAAKVRLLGENVDVEMVWIPSFRPAVLPSGDNPWVVDSGLSAGVSVTGTEAREPDVSLENSEFALRVSAYMPGFDVAASVFSAWDDYPVMHRKVVRHEGRTLVCFSPRYRRITVFGLEFSRPWADFVFRGEMAYLAGRFFEPEELTGAPLKKNSLSWLGGVDWTPGGDWSVIAQMTGVVIFDYDPALEQDEQSLALTLHVMKKLFRQTVSLSSMVYYYPADNDFFERIKLEYDLDDNWGLQAGVDVFGGAGSSFGVYRNNSQAWFKARYSF